MLCKNVWALQFIKEFKSVKLSPFHATGLFLYPLKTKIQGFLFLGVVERDQWDEMSLVIHILQGV